MSIPLPTLSLQNVAVDGDYTLYRINDSHFVVEGPDVAFDKSWLTAHIPAGDWWTDWSGTGERIWVDILR